MTPLIIGQNAEVSQNKAGLRPSKTTEETPKGETFSDVFAESDVSKTPVKGDVLAPTAESGESEFRRAVSKVEGQELETASLSRSPTADTKDTVEGVKVALGGPSEHPVTGAESGPADAEQVVVEATETVPTSDSEKEKIKSAAEGEHLDISEALPPVPGENRNTANVVEGAGGVTRARVDGAGEVLSESSEAIPLDTTKRGGDVPLGVGGGGAGVNTNPTVGETPSQVGSRVGAEAGAQTLTSNSANSVEELPIAYQVRLGVLPPSAQSYVDPAVTGNIPAIQNVPAIAQANLVSIPETKALVAQAGSDVVSTDEPQADLDNVQIETVRGQTFPGDKNVFQNGLPVVTAPAHRAANVSSDRKLDASHQIDLRAEGRDDAQANTVLNSRENILASGVHHLSQAGLFAPFSQPQKGELSKLRMEFEARVVGQSIGINQVLTEATFRPLAQPSADVVQRIAVQLSEAFATKGERKVDVMLNPKELGKVKMQLATGDGGVRVMIHTERTETGDLMRRHINELEKEFKEMGFESISFEFSGDSSDPNTGHSGSDQSPSLSIGEFPDAKDGIDLPASKPLNLGGSGLDMRV